MDFEAARAAIYKRLADHMAANHPDTDIAYENRNQIELVKRTKPFVTCEIVYNDGEQISVELAPRVRYRGAVWLGVHVKEGSGVKAAAELLTSLARAFKTTSFSGVTTMAPVPVPARPVDGWHVQTLRVPFYFDD